MLRYHIVLRRRDSGVGRGGGGEGEGGGNSCHVRHDMNFYNFFNFDQFYHS